MVKTMINAYEIFIAGCEVLASGPVAQSDAFQALIYEFGKTVLFKYI